MSSNKLTAPLRLLVLYCGGTIGMCKDPLTGSLRPFHSIDELLEEICKNAPQLKEECTLTAQTVCNIDSTNIRLDHWQSIAQAIADVYDQYDGFLIIHGTDTIAYTASALSFALGDLGKPVVCTGSLLPANLLGSDAVNNFVMTCQTASMDIGEVVVAFGTRILRGNRSTKVSESVRNAYRSPAMSPLGRLKLIPEMDLHLARPRHDRPLQLKNVFEGFVPILTIAPGVSPDAFTALLDAGADGITLSAFGYGNIPRNGNDFMACITQAHERDIPVVIKSQCFEGMTNLHLYAVGEDALNLGVISAGDMTLEATYTKFLWALGQTRDRSEIRQLMESDIAGELTLGKAAPRETGDAGGN